MNISIDWGGCYLEHKEYFDEMAVSMQKSGHKVGIITGEHEHKRMQIQGSLGFHPDFFHLWGNEEVITNGSMWKVQKIIDENVLVHFDDDATEVKKWTDRWVMKVMDSGRRNKF